MVPWVTPEYELRSFNAASKRTINMYPQSGEGQAKTDWILIGTPGTKLWQDLSSIAGPTARCRGMYYTSTSRLFSVYGNLLIETYYDNGVDDFVNVQRYAFGSSGPNRISMTDNGRYLVLVDGVNMYNYNLDTNTVSIPSLPFTKPLQVEYLAQRIFCITADQDPTTNAGTDRDGIKQNMIWWSDLGLDGPLNWDPLSFASAETSADPIIRMAKRQGQLWLFGPRSYEVWDSSSDPEQPIQFAGGSGSEIGCTSPYSVVTLGDQVFWVGSSSSGKDQVFMSTGYNAQRVSNHSIERFLNQAAELTTQIIGFSYQQEGHGFVIWTIPQGAVNQNGNRTFVFDVSTNMWHERASRDNVTNQLNAWEPLYSSYAFNRVVVGNVISPVLMELSLDYYYDYAPITANTPNGVKPLVRIHQGPQYWDDLRLLRHKEFQIDMQTGIGTQVGQGYQPQAMLQWSDDGGATWSSEYWTSIGKIGEYNARVRWRQLGMSRERVYKCVISDPIQVTMLDARLITEESRNP